MKIREVQEGLRAGKAFMITVKDNESRYAMSTYTEYLTPLDDTRCLSDVHGRTGEHGWGGSAEMLIDDLDLRHPREGWKETPASAARSRLSLWEEGLID